MPISQKNQRFFWRALRTALHDIIKTAERRMPDSQDSSFINDYLKVKEQVIMVIEYLQQIKDSYFEQKHELEKQLNLLEIQLKENTGMIKMLEETNDSPCPGKESAHRDRGVKRDSMINSDVIATASRRCIFFILTPHRLTNN